MICWGFFIIFVETIRDMKLGEFIEQFSHNNIIRLWYENEGGYKSVLDHANDVSMDW